MFAAFGKAVDSRAFDCRSSLHGCGDFRYTAAMLGSARLWLLLGVIGCDAAGETPAEVRRNDDGDAEDAGKCSADFVCDEDKLCSDCDCKCEGLIELWSVELPREVRALAPGPNDSTYFLTTTAPWIARVSRDGKLKDLPQFDLDWATEGIALLGVAGKELIVASTVAPTGERDIHIERLSEDGDVVFSDTFSVIEADELLGGRMQSDGSFSVVGKGFVGSLSADNVWSQRLVAGVSGSAMVGQDWALLRKGQLVELVSLSGDGSVTKAVSAANNGACAFGFGVDDDAYEMCASVSRTTDVEITALDGALEPAWTASRTIYSSASTPGIAAVADGVLFLIDSESSLERLDRFGQSVAEADAAGSYVVPLTSTDVLLLGSHLRDARRWYAPPLVTKVQAPGDACTVGDQCSGGTCCKTEHAALGECAPAEGCPAESLCSSADDCAGSCGSQLGVVDDARCKDTCGSDDDCGDAQRCAQLPCPEAAAVCPSLCLTDCFARGAADCRPEEACVSAGADEDSYVCAPACLGLECGMKGSLVCGVCPADRSCQDNLCVDPCAERECGVFDGVDCGACLETAVCTDGKCIAVAADPCAERECGYAPGADCGECPAGQYCEVDVCLDVPADACATFECGEDRGVNCGDCPEGYCLEGACVDLVPSSPCDELACPAWQYCDESDPDAGCMAAVCRASEPTCIDGLFGTCDPIGSGFDDSQATVDCHLQGLACSPAGCGELSVEEVGVPQTSSFGLVSQNHVVVGNYFEITSNVTLAQMRPRLTLPEGYDFLWIVQRAAVVEGPYELVASAAAAGPATDGWIEAPPALGVELEAGAFYFIGIEAQLSSTSGDALLSDVVPQELSFGTLLGGDYGSGSADLSGPRAFAAGQEITTLNVVP